jgi:hypothetical protein
MTPTRIWFISNTPDIRRARGKRFYLTREDAGKAHARIGWPTSHYFFTYSALVTLDERLEDDQPKQET